MEGVFDEEDRAERLLDAQDRAALLFDAVGERGIITAGISEAAASDAIRDLGAELFGVDRYWHKRIVRAGPNTLMPYEREPPDRIIAEDDIAFVDFGPLFGEWEADFGRTFVIGDDPVKHQICDALPVVFAAGRDFFRSEPDITGAELYAHVVDLTARAGWEYGGPHCGHLVGDYPHERIAGDKVTNYITTGSDLPMRRRDRSGRRCHWILEIHLVDRDRQIGAFYEELLDLERPLHHGSG
jgi:Xaa-Pro aminopeptidase